jgi:hypothetical protein
MPLPTRIVRSVEEFTKIAAELRDKWMGKSDMAILPWFRGQENADWDLVPRFYRTPPTDQETEREIREEFITHAPAFSDTTPTNEWQWYFLMQHYGTPTRLLDWTDGALIGLYFAVRDNRGRHDAAVWALDPWWLNVMVIRKDSVDPVGDVLIPDSKKEDRWLPKRFGRLGALPPPPIAVLPGHFDKRIGAQRSTFTVHGSDLNGLLTAAKASRYVGLAKIIIPSCEIGQVKRSLDTHGIDETTVFPDLEHLSRVVEYRWKKEKVTLPHQRVLTRLRPSKRHGVGVFAIRNIRKGTRLFFDDLDEMVWLEQSKVKPLPKEVRRLYEDFSVWKDGRLGCPRNFNRLTMAWYLNESDQPNVRCVEGYNFEALKNVKQGEELTVDYSTYSDTPRRAGAER